MTFVLLTGSTGLLGGYLLRDLLLAGEQVAVVVRPRRNEDAGARIESVLQPLEQSLGRALPRPVAFAGDLTAPLLGLDPEQVAWLGAHCDRIVHSAASLSFQEADGEPRRSNVEGVRHVIGLCERARIRRLFHVSTAYVCGLRRGTILESELNEGQQFGNVYEETKAEAERLVRDASCLDDFTIFRPSILVGDSRSGYTSTFHGLYAPLRVLQALQSKATVDQMLQVDYLATLGMTGDDRKNLVPVDWVSEAIVKIMERNTLPRQTFALTSPSPTAVRDLLTTFEAALVEYYRARAPSKQAPAKDLNGSLSHSHSIDTSAFEEKFSEHFAIYRSYWRDDPDFDSSRTQELLPDRPCPPMDAATLMRLCRYALGANFGYPRRMPSTPSFQVCDWLAADVSGAPYGSDRDVAWGLICSGPGGGSWTLAAVPGGRWRAVQGVASQAPWVRMRTAVLESLVCGRTTYSDASRRGQVATTFDPICIRQFEQFFSNGERVLCSV